MKINDIKKTINESAINPESMSSEFNNEQPTSNRNVVNYLATDKKGRYFLLSYQKTAGTNSLSLNKKLQAKARDLGFDRYDVIAQWTGDIDSELNDAKRMAASWESKKRSHPAQYYDNIKKVDELENAKAIMANNTIEEARDPQAVINKFLSKKQSRSDRSADLVNNPNKVTQLKHDEQLDEYKPGVTVLTREISFGVDEPSFDGGMTGQEEYDAVKKIRWPYGIEVKFNDRTRSVRFKTAKMKTVAKLLSKVIDFGATSAGEVLDLPVELMFDSKMQEANVGDKIKYRNIKTKRVKTGSVKSIDMKNGQKRYEVDGGKYVYDADLEEASYDSELDETKPIIITGVKGMKSKSFRRKFRNMAAFDRWADSDAAGDYEIYQITNESNNLTKYTYKTHYADIDNALKQQSPEAEIRKLGYNKAGNLNVQDTTGNTWTFDTVSKRLAPLQETAPKNKSKKVDLGDEYKVYAEITKSGNEYKIDFKFKDDNKVHSSLQVQKLAQAVATAKKWIPQKSNDFRTPASQVKEDAPTAWEPDMNALANDMYFGAGYLIDEVKALLNQDPENQKLKKIHNAIINMVNGGKRYSNEQLIAAIKKAVKNDITEISNKTRGEYISKAKADRDRNWNASRSGMTYGTKHGGDLSAKAIKRQAGIDRAIKHMKGK